jgi:hypothetical protein
MTLKGEFELESWNEQPFVEADGEKLTHASVTQQFRGDVVGQGLVEWLMCYRPDGTARFVGLQRVEGTVDGRAGSIVLQSIGDFDGTTAAGEWTVVEGSGTGELKGVSGTGHFAAPHGPKATFHLELSFS